MKKLLIVFGSIAVILLAAAIIIPVVFKDDIKAAIDKSLAESVNADIVWDTDGFDLSLFTNFPNATAELNNFGIFNRAPFDGQLLFAVEKLEVEVDLFSLFGEQIEISGIEMVHPEIMIRILEDGTANYDIALSSDSEDTASETEEPAAFNIGIDHWSISEGHLVYDDATFPFRMELKNITHTGSGDFNEVKFDLNTFTAADSVSITYDGVEYLSNKYVEADGVVEISDNYSRYTFKENAARINDFTLSFDGFLALLEDGSMDMDISYAAQDNTFKSLLSIIPGMYSSSFEQIETNGALSFDGTVKGKYDSISLPAFSLALVVENAMFKYPDLPTAIENIAMDLKVNNADGIIENTVVDLSSFHMDFGSNPIDAAILVKNLRNYDMKAAINGTLNLGELSQMFPMDGTELKGNYAIMLNAEGIYDSISSKFPAIDAKMSLDNGYVKSTELPYAMEDLHFVANISDPSGTMKDFKAVVSDFTMIMDGEPFKANLIFQNLNNYTWDLQASGGINLEKIMSVFPMEGIELIGNINADIKTKGNMAAIEAERYTELPTSGSIEVDGLSYKDKELPYDVTISTAKASFSPQAISVSSYNGTVGKSDMDIRGTVSNYMAYLFSENQTLEGTMLFKSNLLDLNEFMVDGEEQSSTSDDEEELEVVQIPENINFVMNSTIKEVRMMDLTMNNAAGTIIVRDGKVNLSDLKFNMLEGQFAINGAYSAIDPAKPEYNFKLNIDKLSIPKAFENFEIVKKYVPIASQITGDFSTDLDISGLLTQNMMPDLGTINAAGLVKIAEAALAKTKIMSSISSLTNLSSLDKAEKINIKDVLMSATIQDGKLMVDPFDVQLGDYKTTITGATSLDGRIAYQLKMDVPAGQLGSQFNSLVSSLSGTSTSGNETVPITIGLGGTYLDPKPQLMMSEQKEQVKDAVKTKAREEVKDAASDLIGNLLGTKTDTVKSDSLKTDSTNSQQKLEDAKEKLKSLFKKKKNNN